jgi:hypothetical protein
MAQTSSASESVPNDEAMATASTGREEMASKLVNRFALWSGVAGLVPLPVVDVIAVGGLQVQMLRGFRRSTMSSSRKIAVRR